VRGVRFAEEEGVFVVQLGPFRGEIEVEDTPFWVEAYDPQAGEIELSDRSSERIEPETLALDPDGVLRVRVKARFPARFTHAGQAHLLLNLEFRGDDLVLRVGDCWVPVPALSGELDALEGPAGVPYKKQ
jgi:hypothetical protein